MRFHLQTADSAQQAQEIQHFALRVCRQKLHRLGRWLWWWA